MKLEFTPALERALDRARQIAADAGATAAEPRHLLQGILAEEEGKGVELLVQAGADWPRVQAHLGLPVATPTGDATSVALHDASRIILGSAGQLTRLLGDEGSIATDHLLLALLSTDQELRQELEALGLDFARFRANIVGEEASPLVMDEPLVLHEPIEQAQTARILDANVNRAREAFRVLEDYARFVLDDAFLSASLKTLRHDLASALTRLPAGFLLQGRDAERDVGAAISTEQEWQRANLHAVVQANAKRLQEALRSLEEFGKIVESGFAQQIEKIRYRAYTLESALVHGSATRQRLADIRLCVLVTDKLCRASLAGTVKEALLGGAQMIQLREKDVDDRTLLAHARMIRELTRGSGALFIVNDRPDIALLAEADGVHLGQDDLPARAARQLLGPNALIGVSTHDLEQVRQAVLDGADYIGIGPVFASQTKDFDALAGLEFVRQAVTETSLPAFAIGGVTRDNVAQVLHAGAKRIAVSYAVCATDNPRGAARELELAMRQQRASIVPLPTA